MRRSQASIVYMPLGQLLLRLPGRVAFHRLDPGRATWPTYPDGVRAGAETQVTTCGRLIYHIGETYTTKLDALRLDNARLVGHPCQRCWNEGEV